MSKLLKVFLVAMVLALVPSAALAVPIFGTFDIGGSEVTATGLATIFTCTGGVVGIRAPCPPSPPPVVPDPLNYGNYIVTNGTGGFVPYVFQGGYDHNLSQATTPAGQPISLMNFMFFSSTAGNPVIPPNVAFDLTFIPLGTSGQAECALPPAAGQQCTPTSPALITPANPMGLSPLNLQNLTLNTSTAAFTVQGVERILSTGETTPFSGVFTASFTVPYQTLLSQINAGLPITNSYAGTFTVPIPEPGTSAFLMIGGALILARFGLRKAARRN